MFPQFSLHVSVITLAKYSVTLYLYSASSFKLSSLHSVILVPTTVFSTPLTIVDKINNGKVANYTFIDCN